MFLLFRLFPCIFLFSMNKDVKGGIFQDLVSYYKLVLCK